MGSELLSAPITRALFQFAICVAACPTAPPVLYGINKKELKSISGFGLVSMMRHVLSCRRRELDSVTSASSCDLSRPRAGPRLTNCKCVIGFCRRTVIRTRVVVRLGSPIAIKFMLRHPGRRLEPHFVHNHHRSAVTNRRYTSRRLFQRVA
jgi:hypothetical protein